MVQAPFLFLRFSRPTSSPTHLALASRVWLGAMGQGGLLFAELPLLGSRNMASKVRNCDQSPVMRQMMLKISMRVILPVSNESQKISMYAILYVMNRISAQKGGSIPLPGTSFDFPSFYPLGFVFWDPSAVSGKREMTGKSRS